MKSIFFEKVCYLGLQLVLWAVNKLGILWPGKFLIQTDVESIKREVKRYVSSRKDQND